MRTGRPKQPLVLRNEEHEKLQQWARRPKTAALGLAIPHRSGLRRRPCEPSRGPAVRDERPHRGQVAGGGGASCPPTTPRPDASSPAGASPPAATRTATPR